MTVVFRRGDRVKVGNSSAVKVVTRTEGRTDDEGQPYQVAFLETAKGQPVAGFVETSRLTLVAGAPW